MIQVFNSNFNPNLSWEHDNWYQKPSTSLGNHVNSSRDEVSSRGNLQEEKWVKLKGKLVPIMKLERIAKEELDLCRERYEDWRVKNGSPTRDYFLHSWLKRLIKAENRWVRIWNSKHFAAVQSSPLKVKNHAIEIDDSLDSVDTTIPSEEGEGDIHKFNLLIPYFFFDETINSGGNSNSQIRETSSTKISRISKFLNDKTVRVDNVKSENGIKKFSADVFTGKMASNFFLLLLQWLVREFMERVGICDRELLVVVCFNILLDNIRSLFDRGKHAVITSNCFKKLSCCCGFQFVFWVIQLLVFWFVDNAGICVGELLVEISERLRVSLLSVLGRIVKTSVVVNSNVVSRIGQFGVGFYSASLADDKVMITTKHSYGVSSQSRKGMNAVANILSRTCQFENIEVNELGKRIGVKLGECVSIFLISSRSIFDRGKMFKRIRRIFHFTMCEPLLWYVLDKFCAANIQELIVKHWDWSDLGSRDSIATVIDNDGVFSSAIRHLLLSEKFSYPRINVTSRVFDRGKEYKLVKGFPYYLFMLVDGYYGVYGIRYNLSNYHQLWGFMHQPTLPGLAMKSGLGLGKHIEAEKEWRRRVLNKEIPGSVWLSSVKAYFQAMRMAGADTTEGVFLGMLEWCHVGPQAAARVALVDKETAANERTSRHTVLWNCGADHFRIQRCVNLGCSKVIQWLTRDAFGNLSYWTVGLQNNLIIGNESFFPRASETGYGMGYEVCDHICFPAGMTDETTNNREKGNTSSQADFKMFHKSRSHETGGRSGRKRWKVISVKRPASRNLNNGEEYKYNIVLNMRELASNWMTVKVLEEFNAIDPKFLVQDSVLLFHSKKVEFNFRMLFDRGKGCKGWGCSSWLNLGSRFCGWTFTAILVIQSPPDLSLGTCQSGYNNNYRKRLCCHIAATAATTTPDILVLLKY